ncbi:MAG TPA: ABC transporter ATP-binding protein [Candidatus Blautia pullicola]|uniref:Quaternary amine transport ATP-binding protein n=1 Tax=Candidatus Blautia pullicola TaxID=2838498 RepID=A0A9D2JSS8_9FIRM|nr:ABC transporter ATP-binding protein [Candidatus Blautia pullicola]
MIEIKNVSKSYRDKLILRNINLVFETGQFIVIIGSSGCGKTTLLKMINKLLPMDSGDILIDGKSIREIPDTKLRRRIGYVIQDGGLFPHLTVRENLEIMLKIEGMPPEKREKRVLELLDMVNLNPKIYSNSYPCQLSGGQKQRVGVARAFAADTDLILMDEPFSALDPLTREELQNEIVKLQKRYKKTIVFVTHDMDEAIKCADKICVIQNGQVIQFDQPEKILKYPQNDYVEMFIGKNRLWGNPSYIRAGDIMCRESFQLSKDRTVLQALQIMRQNMINSVLITHGNSRKLDGVVWLENIRKLPDSQLGMPIQQIMSQDYKTVYEETTLQEIINTIDYKKSGVIPVLNQRGELKGILTKSILLSVLSKRYRQTEGSEE